MPVKNDTQLVIRAQEEISLAGKWISEGRFGEKMTFMWGLEEWIGIFQEKSGQEEHFFFSAKETIMRKFDEHIAVIIARIYFGT